MPDAPQLNVDIAPFPAGAEFTNSEFLEWLEANMKITVPDGFLVGHVGDVEPPPNSGPWFKTSEKRWYAWDTTTASYVPEQGSDIGEIKMFAFNGVDLAHYVPCDGSAIPRQAPYAQLYAKIATLYGTGDGSTTFNVPDMRGLVPVGAGQGSGLTDRPIGLLVGAEKKVATTDDAPHNLLPGRALVFAIRYA